MEEEERSQSNNSMPVYSARLARESMGGGSGRGETVQIVVFITPSLRRLYAVSTPSLRRARSIRSSSPSPPIDEAKAAIPRPRGLKASRRDRERERSEKRAERSERESRDSEKEARKEQERGTGIKGVSPITTKAENRRLRQTVAEISPLREAYASLQMEHQLLKNRMDQLEWSLSLKANI